MQKDLSPIVATLTAFARARKAMLDSRIDRKLPVSTANRCKGGSGGNTPRYVLFRDVGIGTVGRKMIALDVEVPQVNYRASI